MNSMTAARVLRKYALILLLVAVPVFATAQHKPNNSPPPKSAPAPKAPAQHSSPPAQHTNTTSHTNTNQGHTGTNGPSHTGTNGPGHTGNSTTGHTGNNTGAGHTGNTMGAGHTGTNQPGHGGNNSMGHTGTNGPGNKGGAMSHVGTNNNATHGAGPGGKGATNRTPPGRQVTLRGGGSAHIRPNGQIRSVNRNGMHIEHGMHGGRTVVSTRNGVRVVSVGRRGGYVQRAYVVRGGRSYYSRTSYYHGAYRAGVYRGYYYGGRPYYGYYPAYYYHPAYYGWAYNPWPAPAYYGWGWGGAPWYGYYGAYYAPYPVYPSAAFWLTDFMVAATLQAAYQAQAEQTGELLPLTPDPTLVASLMPLAAPDAKPAMSKEVKDALAEEVKLTLAAEKADAEKPKSAASSGGSQPAQSTEAPPALDPNFKLFMVSSDMSLTTDGDECALSQGDVIQRTTETADDDGNVNVKVVASNKNDCAIGKEGPVSTDDLQEMYNSFREGLKDGMGELAKKSGQGGLPKAPDTATSDGDVPAPPPDKSAEKALTDQQSAADQTETEVKQEAGSGGGGR